MNSQQAMSAYTQTKTQSGVESASPSQLITMLLDGALERVAAAQGHMERGDLAPQGELIGKAIDIVASLDSYLDHERGGDVSRRSSPYTTTWCGSYFTQILRAIPLP